MIVEELCGTTNIPAKVQDTEFAKASRILPRTCQMELDDLPSVGKSERVEDEVKACKEANETEAAEDETKLNMEKKLLWEGIRQKIRAGKGGMEYDRRWKCGEETDFDRLLIDTAKHLQIVSRDKIALHWRTRAYIANEMRS